MSSKGYKDDEKEIENIRSVALKLLTSKVLDFHISKENSTNVIRLLESGIPLFPAGLSLLCESLWFIVRNKLMETIPSNVYRSIVLAAEDLDILSVLRDKSYRKYFDRFLLNMSDKNGGNGSVAAMHCYLMTTDILSEVAQYNNHHATTKDTYSDPYKAFKVLLEGTRAMHKQFFYSANMCGGLSESLRMDIASFLSSNAHIKALRERDLLSIDKKYIISSAVRIEELLRSLEEDTFNHTSHIYHTKFAIQDISSTSEDLKNNNGNTNNYLEMLGAFLSARNKYVRMYVDKLLYLTDIVRRQTVDVSEGIVSVHCPLEETGNGIEKEKIVAIKGRFGLYIISLLLLTAILNIMLYCTC